MSTLTQRQKETLDGIMCKANKDTLNQEDINLLLDKEYVYTEWSSYGLKLSEKGFNV